VGALEGLFLFEEAAEFLLVEVDFVVEGDFEVVDDVLVFALLADFSGAEV
jgi:hypothetical protein